MNYYLLGNDEIVLFDTDRSRLQTTLKFKPELKGQPIQETEREIILLDNKYVFADEHQEEIEEQEQEKADAEKEEALEVAINDLIHEMSKADLMGDEEWKAELREEYEALMAQSEGE